MISMQKRVADIIADILVEHGITDIFSLVGGGAMFLNDAFGHHQGLRVMYNQHEQACSMAAEGYVLSLIHIYTEDLSHRLPQRMYCMA